MNFINPDLNQKLQAINQYLTQRLTHYPDYQTLIDDLNTAIKSGQSPPITVTLIGHSKVLVEDIKSLTEEKAKFGSWCKLQTTTLPNNLEKVLRKCELLCLVKDGTKPVSRSEKKLIKKLATANVTGYCLILTKNTNLSENSSLKAIEFRSLSNYIAEKKLQNITSYFLPQELLKSIDSSQELEEYSNFLESFLESCSIKIKQKNQEYFSEKIQDYFETNKAQCFSQIQEHRRIFIGGQRLDEFKQKINQSYNQINQTIQNTFRNIKQEINQEKIQLTNPFLYDTMMYRVQSAIQDATVIEYKDKNKVYLSLAIKNKDYNQLLHSYILELCHQELNLWLEKQWEILDNDSETGKINELTKTIKQKLEFINPLLPQITISNIENRFSFEISDYVSFSLLEENNKIPFDYHYSQSAWFRLTVVLFVVAMIFIFTNKIFGFIILFIQLLNLLTGRDPKKMRLRQQTKEMKRTMDSKYQFFVRFIADKFLQNFCQYLEEESKQYQEEVNLIVEQAKEELEQLKLKIDYLKEQIAVLKEDQAEVTKILQD